MQRNFWDKRANIYERNVSDSPLLNNAVKSATTRLGKDDVVLDVGCGTGEFCLGISTSVSTVIGIDTSIKMIELAENKLLSKTHRNIHVLRCDIFNPRLDRNRFTTITAFNLIHLLKNKADFLTRVHGLLPVGGLFISETPCLKERSWFFRRFVAAASMWGLAPSISAFTFRELEQLISRSGFEIINAEIVDEKSAIKQVIALKKQ